MKKETLKKIIIENIDFINDVQSYSRDYVLEPNGNYVITGIRRGGKSFLLVNELKQTLKGDRNSFVYINFEDERFIEFEVADFDLIVECAKELHTEKPVFYFDEIQNIDGWEKFVRRLADTNYRVLITGSNAKMLSKEVSSVLGGRFFSHEMLPLSFKEFLDFSSFSLKKNYEYSDQRFKIKEFFGQFLHYGGFPELFKFSNPREYLSNIYMKVFYGDVIARNNIQNEHILKLLIKKLAESVNNETSINRIKNLIKSTGAKVGNNTLFDYLDYLFDSYLIYSIENFTLPFSEKESKKKYYFVDQGILNLFLIDQRSKLLENSVFVELHRRYKKNIFYYKRNLEVDFYLPDHELIIQVSYSIADFETRERELKAMASAMKELELDKGLILTYDEDDEIEYKGLKVDVVPVWKWLLR
jgi:predicted AAA+ superfamily ATPase